MFSPSVNGTPDIDCRYAPLGDTRRGCICRVRYLPDGTCQARTDRQRSSYSSAASVGRRLSPANSGCRLPGRNEYSEYGPSSRPVAGRDRLSPVPSSGFAAGVEPTVTVRTAARSGGSDGLGRHLSRIPVVTVRTKRVSERAPITDDHLSMIARQIVEGAEERNVVIVMGDLSGIHKATTRGGTSMTRPTGCRSPACSTISSARHTTRVSTCS